MGYIAVDLDGTLAVSHPGENYDGITIGPPIPKMVERVKAWLGEGKEVRILTARVSQSSLNCNDKSEDQVRKAIMEWCKTHIGVYLPITCVKCYNMEALYDDRAVQVQRNTGELMTDVVRREARRAERNYAGAVLLSSMDDTLRNSSSWDEKPMGGFH